MSMFGHLHGLQESILTELEVDRHCNIVDRYSCVQCYPQLTIIVCRLAVRRISFALIIGWPI